MWKFGVESSDLFSFSLKIGQAKATLAQDQLSYGNTAYVDEEYSRVPIYWYNYVTEAPDPDPVMRIVMPMPQSCHLLGCDPVACTPHPCFQQLSHSLSKSYSWQLFRCIPCLLCKQIYWPSHEWNSILIFFAYLLYLGPCLEIWQLGTAWYMVHGLGIYECTHL